VYDLNVNRDASFTTKLKYITLPAAKECYSFTGPHTRQLRQLPGCLGEFSPIPEEVKLQIHAK